MTAYDVFGVYVFACLLGEEESVRVSFIVKKKTHQIRDRRKRLERNCDDSFL